VRLHEPPAPSLESLRGDGPVEELVVVAVAEGLQAVDARRGAGRRATVHHRARRGNDVAEAFDDLVKEARTARHRVPEERFDFVALDVANDEVSADEPKWAMPKSATLTRPSSLSKTFWVRGALPSRGARGRRPEPS
jgi:hypothetical protein